MTNLENFLSIIKRRGYEHMPVSFSMCPSLYRKYDDYLKEHPFELSSDELRSDFVCIDGISATCAEPDTFKSKYYAGKSFREGTNIDGWGVAHEPGSAAAFHMTYMHHPMEDFDSVEQLLEYPLPVFDLSRLPAMSEQAKSIHASGDAVMGSMQCTIWECAWYMRGMENLMCDMMSGDEMASVLLDRVTDTSVMRARAFAEAGCDVIFLGDDIGMQNSIMLSRSLYGEWLQPRLKRVIDAAKAVNPDVVVFYHSCGHVTELIPQLIEAGVDVLDPVQPECMDFRAIHERFGEVLSFHGTIGTQSVMPFGTPDDVRRAVFDNLDVAGEKGGLLVCPTHLLEPEVPLENVLAYIRACRDYVNR